MSKVKTINLTTEERKWLDRQVRRKAELYASLEGKQRQIVDKEAKVWEALKDRMAQDELPFEGESSVLTLNRQEIRLIQVLVIDRLAYLTGKTIPEYRKRIELRPEEADRFIEYLDAGIELQQGLVTLSSKIGRML